ncbi:MAG: superoxide dismutase [Tannerella sp.]|jgi:Fe-Mn family superoxide dismutase|nr:superoxide dismutase [Tannerella sp.]
MKTSEIIYLAAFALPALPYSYDAFPSSIDALTMQIHYEKHHQAYVNNLNDAVGKHPELREKSLEFLVSHISELPEDVRTAIRNNGGGHFNHSFFWQILTPKSTRPSAALEEAIVQAFGSMDSFKAEFKKAATGRFGSGWAWLIVSDGKLKVISTPNQDNPLMDDAAVKGKPVLTLDVWEHAYYLKYQSNRGGYVDAFWNIVNWEKVSELFEQ